MTIDHPTEIDIIILSYAQDVRLKQITQNGIDSLVNSEDPADIKFNILVIESQNGLNNYQYPFTRTIYPDEPFGFHRYLNIGIKLTSSPYVCLCNNDLIFHPGWATEILKYMHEFPDLMSASPLCANAQSITGIPFHSGLKYGYRVGYEITGWCLLMRRTLFNIIGELDENYLFVGADSDYANTLALLNIKHALVTSALVDHLNSETLKSQSQDKQDVLANNLIPYHFKKWYHRVLPFKVV